MGITDIIKYLETGKTFLYPEPVIFECTKAGLSVESSFNNAKDAIHQPQLAQITL